MNSKYIFLAIVVMAIATYLPRVIPLAVIRTKIKNRFFKSFLTYIPYGVLSAMIFPAIFYSSNSLLSATAGTIVALILSYFKKGLLTVALSAVAMVFIIEFMFI